ncbi:pneumococcal-type histidine triad protein [Streptococcus didelphis]|uniref:Pneumococcal-type histidine triad protein n=1 Tax=Streptococcus didelphis TaxID=102886 RepID=A0ABY9LJ31_9STRE|nr:pneumococcal-type histidine triad protein [Streptococcus didelphis]WMB28738.1 pneumococcal-type histidine triad protein [Streptococcus didelphis]WMB29397.1 pneumococcal-type histidine triad protein [Streptococcus didelphis]
MKQKKVILGIGGAAAAALAIGVSGYQLGMHQAKSAKDNNRIAYVDSKKSKHVDTKKENLTPDEISAKEGISAEQIVIKITDDGYVTSHGDHYHYYNGKIPFDAIISEELVMKDPNYKLNKADIISDHRDGYIIKVNGNYYLYLKDPAHAKNVRTKAEVEEQRKSNGKAGHHGSSNGATTVSRDRSGRYTTDDGYVFTVESIIQDTGDAFIVSHGNHFHYVPKADLAPWELQAANEYLHGKSPSKQIAEPIVHSRDNKPFIFPTVHHQPLGNSHYQPGNGPIPGGTSHNGGHAADALAAWDRMPENQRHREADGLVFNPRQVTKRNSFGYVIPHGDHFHIIPFNQLNSIEIEAAEAFLNGGNIPSVTPSKPSQTEKPIIINGVEIKQSGLGKDGKPYTTDDGYVFSPESIRKVDGDGVVAEHVVNGHSHMHYLPLVDLERSELEAVQEFLNKQANNKDKKDISKDNSFANIKAEVRVKPEEMPKSLVPLLYASKIANGSFVVPHHNHFHYYDYKWLTEWASDRGKNFTKYSTEDFIATALYYMEHKEERNNLPFDWLNKQDNEVDTTEPYLKVIKEAAKQYKIDSQELLGEAVRYAKQYKIPTSTISFLPNRKISFKDSNGNSIVKDIETIETIDIYRVNDKEYKDWFYKKYHFNMDTKYLIGNDGDDYLFRVNGEDEIVLSKDLTLLTMVEFDEYLENNKNNLAAKEVLASTPVKVSFFDKYKFEFDALKVTEKTGKGYIQLVNDKKIEVLSSDLTADQVAAAEQQVAKLSAASDKVKVQEQAEPVTPKANPVVPSEPARASSAPAADKASSQEAPSATLPANTSSDKDVKPAASSVASASPKSDNTED